MPSQSDRMCGDLQSSIVMSRPNSALIFNVHESPIHHQSECSLERAIRLRGQEELAEAAVEESDADLIHLH